MRYSTILLFFGSSMPISHVSLQAGDSESKFSKIKDILSKLPIGGGNDTVNQGEEMDAAAKAYHFDPDNVAPPEVQERLLQLLKWRDQVYREVVAKIEMVPGLADLLDELTNALNACKSPTCLISIYSTNSLPDVYTILSPYIVVCTVTEVVR